jgi:hypothetical protein
MMEITADNPLRYSQLSKFAKSPAHYLEARTHDSQQTGPMERGSALHAVVLGTAQVIAYPGKTRSGKAWEAFEAQHQGKHILTGNAYERVMGMAEAVWSDPRAKDLLYGNGVVYEHTLRTEMYGKHCRATPDVRSPDYLAELKTTATSEPEQFMRHAVRMLYHGQLAFYLQACAAARIKVQRDAYVIAVEANPPHPVVVFQQTEQCIEMGERAIRLWIERLRSCEAAGFFPGYVQSVVTWDIDHDLELQFADEDEHAEAVA